VAEKILITNDLEKLEDYLHHDGSSYTKIVILVDENTSSDCWPNLAGLCPSLENAELMEIPAGESSKSIEIAEQLWNSLQELKADRSSLLINLGGGVVCDLGGFIASTYMRGIDFIHLPTSLLAQVDASIGGKNGIDLGDFKNLIGTITPPKLCLIHPSFLETLDQRQINNGFAEMIKHSLLEGGKHLELLKSIDIPSAENLQELIEYSIQFKKGVVELDRLEQNQRKMLNFGHSIGHAVESLALSNAFDLLHGEAIALGMAVEAEIGKLKGIGNEKFNSEVLELIQRHFELSIPSFMTAQNLIPFLQSDKKNKAGEFLFVLLEAAGKPIIDVVVQENEIHEAWHQVTVKING